MQTDKRAQYTILSIDDDEEDQMHLYFIIKELALSYKLLFFNGGPPAIQYLESINRLEHPSIIILDYNMPIMNGGEILQYLKFHAELSHIPTIVYSSLMSHSLATQLINCGAVKSLSKYGDREELKNFLVVMNIILENKHQEIRYTL